MLLLLVLLVRVKVQIFTNVACVTCTKIQVTTAALTHCGPTNNFYMPQQSSLTRRKLHLRRNHPAGDKIFKWETKKKRRSTFLSAICFLKQEGINNPVKRSMCRAAGVVTEEPALVAAQLFHWTARLLSLEWDQDGCRDETLKQQQRCSESPQRQLDMNSCSVKTPPGSRRLCRRLNPPPHCTEATGRDYLETHCSPDLF